MILDREPFSGEFSLDDVQNLEDTQSEKKQPQQKAPPKQAADKPQKNGTTLTGEPADKVVINPVYESKESTAVMTFGRFNPPTVGHEKLIHSVENVAKEHGGQAHIVASHSEGTSKDPLPQKAKLGYLSKIAHKGTTVMGSSKEEPTIMHAAAKLHAQGHQHLVVVAGSDRVDEYHRLLHKYNGVDAKHGHYNFKSIKVVSAGHRDPDAEGVEGMSGTKMRSLAREGKHKEFKSGLPKALHPHAKEIAGHIRSVAEQCEILEGLISATAKYVGNKIKARVDRAADVITGKATVRQAVNNVKSQMHPVRDAIDTAKQNIKAPIQKAKAGIHRTLHPIQTLKARTQINQKKMPFGKAVNKIKKHVVGIKRELQKEDVVLDEAASIQLRLHRAAIMKRNIKRIERARQIARQRLAKAIQMRRRALKRARSLVRARVAGAQGAKYNELSMSDKIAVDRMTDKRKKQIIRIANRLAPRVRRDEVQRLAAIAAGKQVRNTKTPIIASYEMDMTKTLTEKAASALVRKAEKANVSLAQIAEVYAAGLASYPADSKQTPQQWAFASVNTFLANVNEWAVKHDGVDQDHPDQDVRRLFAGKKNVVNHLTKYKDSAEKRAKVLKDKGFKNVRIEENLNEVSDQTLDKAWHGRYQQALAAKRGSPEHQKAHKSMGKIGDVMKKRIDKKLTHMVKHDPEAYKKSAVASAEQDRKRGWTTENNDICPVCGQTPCNCTHIDERKSVMYTARNMANVDFDKLPKVHTFAQHQKLKADVEKETDADKAARKKADLIRRAAGEVNRKIVETKDTGSVYVRTANKLVRAQSPQIADTKKRMIAALKGKDYNAFASIILYLLKDQLKGNKRIVQEDKKVDA